MGEKNITEKSQEGEKNQGEEKEDNKEVARLALEKILLKFFFN